MRHRYPALALAIIATARALHADTLTLSPIDAQAITDTGSTWTVNLTSTALNASRFSSGSQRRGLMEFDLSAIPVGSTITAASFSYTTSSYTASTGSGGLGYPKIEFYAYSGDGSLTPADATRSPANPVGTSPFITDTLTPVVTPFDAAALNSIFTGAPSPKWLGVWSYQVVQGLQASFYSTEGTSRPPSERPLLTLTYSSPPASNIYVTGHDVNVREYTPAGTLVRTLPVPYPGTRGIADDELRGTTVDHNGRLHVFNGTFNPHISTYDPNALTWTHRTDPGLSVTTPVTVGSVTTIGFLTFASDHRTFTNPAKTANGIVRFNTAATETHRFANSESPNDNVIDLARGHDGLLYALTDNSDESGHIRVYNPYSMALLRTVTLPEHVRNIAVNADGDIFATTWGTTADQGSLHRFNGTTGALIKSLPIADTAATLDLDPNGSIVVGTWTNGVYLTTQSLTPATQVVTGDLDTTFVSFATPAPQRGWRPAAGAFGGNFSDPANWTGPVPGATDGNANSIAVFSAKPPSPSSAAYTVTIDAPVTLGTIALDSPHAHVLAGTQTITLSVPAPQRAFIDVVQGDHTLRAPVTLVSDLTVHTAPGASLFISSPTTGTGPTSAFDLASHNLIWDYAPTDPAPTLNLRRALLTGRTSALSGAQTGLFSSTAKSDPTANLAIGYAEAADLGLSTFQGQPVDASAILFLLTTHGDTDLNGTIDADDYARLDRGLALRLNNWLNGDFDYNGIINASDYLLIDKAYLHQQGTPLSPTLLSQRESQFGPTYVHQLLTAIPEPVGLACLFAAFPLLPRRRTPNATAEKP